VCHEIAEAKSGHGHRFRKRPQHDQVGILRQQRERSLSAEFVIGLIEKHEARRSFKDSPRAEDSNNDPVGLFGEQMTVTAAFFDSASSASTLKLKSDAFIGTVVTLAS
jgi:hypothetical protein